MTTPRPDPDWTSIVARHARAAGVDLSPPDRRRARRAPRRHLPRGPSRRRRRRRGPPQAAHALERVRAGAAPPRAAAGSSCRLRAPRQRRRRGVQTRSLAVGYALRMALRQFRLQPAFAVIVILVLGLGTGAATAVYTIVDSVVLRPLPYRAPDRLVKLWDTNTEKGLAHDPFSPVTFMDYRGAAGVRGRGGVVAPRRQPRDPGLEPSASSPSKRAPTCSRLLGVGPQLGEGFPQGRAVLRPQQPDRGHQRSAVAHALRRRSRA